MRPIIFLNEESGYWKCPHCKAIVSSGKSCPNCGVVEGGNAQGYDTLPLYSKIQGPNKKKTPKREEQDSNQITMDIP